MLLAPVLATTGAIVLAAAPAQAENPDADEYRAQYHFTVPDHWMNDPQRPVYIDGKYHYYYLYDVDYNGSPGGTAWRHATTTDMVTFHDEGIAIPEGLPEGTPMAGSVVVDTANTSGLGAGTVIALVSVDDHGPTDVYLYSSTDGYSFTRYGSGPVIPNGNTDAFRDPKVEWDAANSQWVLVITAGDRLMFYTSDDLINWTYRSDFDAPNIAYFECPDIFQIRADDNTMHWVLGASANGEPFGGPNNYGYWTGDWDGTTFTADSSAAQWLDYGHDWYAAVTWPDASATNNDRRFAIGWMNKWGDNYVNNTRTWPADGFNGTDSIVREITLKEQPDSSYRLASSPVSTLDNIATNVFDYGDVNVNGHLPLGYHGTAYRIDTNITWSSLSNVGLQLRRSPDGAHRVEVGYYNGEIYLNRENRDTQFPNGEKHVPYGSTTSVHLTILVDNTSVELYAGDYVAITDDIWLDKMDTGLALYTDGGAATFNDLVITEFADVMTLSDPGTPYQDFESGYDGWGTTGSAFGSGPVSGTLPNQQAVTGYAGSGLVNSYLSGDSTTGTLTSPAFTIGDPYLNFLIGGGDHAMPANLLADFEGSSWGSGWTATGSFNGQGPSSASLPNQVGSKVADTFVNGGDPSTGTITSPEFTITRDYIDFLIAGGNHPWGSAGNTSVQLVIDGDVYRTATGPADAVMQQVAWDVHALQGRRAQIVIEDNNTSLNDWGHLMVDQIMFWDSPNAAAGASNDATAVNLIVGGNVVRTATGDNLERLHWVTWDLTDYTGQSAQIQVVDNNTGSWGHINADQFTFSDRAAG
jgi:sucrose-6-phosphate hydrolase SacC (GH32 family)